MLTPAYALTSTERVLPRLALDFTTGVLDPRVTVTRALNTATRINSSGLLEVVNANLPRFDYTSVTLASRGLLIEEARQNLVLYSQNFANPYWIVSATGTAVAPVITPNSGTAPDGTNTLFKVDFNRGAGNTAGNTSALDSSSISIPTSAAYTMSVWIAAATSNDIGKQVAIRSVAGTYKVITLTAALQRVDYTQTSTATSTSFSMVSRGTVTVDNQVSVLIWGAQIELGAFATSYIPTTTAVVDRNADVVSMTGTNFSDWFNASEGAFSATYSRIAIKRYSRVFAASNVAESDQITLISGLQADGRENGNVQVASVQNILYPGNTPAAGQVTQFCLSYKTGSSAASLNASTVSTSSAAFANPAPTQFNIGSIVASGQYLNGHVQKVMYWPQDLTDAEVRAFSKL